MLSSVAIQQTGLRNHPSNPLFTSTPPQNQIFPTLKNPLISPHPKKVSFKSFTISDSASSLTLESSILDDKNEKKQGKRKLSVVVKPMEKPRLVLRFIWMEKNIGIAIDQVIPGGYGTIPLSPYYFWPRKDAWEELKVMLESKAWISDRQKVILLNQTTDIINLWQQSGGGTQ